MPPRGVEDSALLVLIDVSGHPIGQMSKDQVVQEEQTFLFSDFRCDVKEICSLMDFFAVWNVNFYRRLLYLYRARNKITQLSIPTHAQLQRHRLKFIKNYLSRQQH